MADEPGGTKRVLRFSDGSQKFADPDLYIPKQLQSQLTRGSDLDPAIKTAFQTALAAAMSTAAAKSAADSRANPR